MTNMAAIAVAVVVAFTVVTTQTTKVFTVPMTIVCDGTIRNWMHGMRLNETIERITIATTTCTCTCSTGNRTTR